MHIYVFLHADLNYAINFCLSKLFTKFLMFFWTLGIPWEKAYSYFIINDEHWAFSVIRVERYDKTATNPIFKFFF